MQQFDFNFYILFGILAFLSILALVFTFFLFFILQKILNDSFSCRMVKRQYKYKYKSNSAS